MSPDFGKPKGKVFEREPRAQSILDLVNQRVIARLKAITADPDRSRVDQALTLYRQRLDIFLDQLGEDSEMNISGDVFISPGLFKEFQALGEETLLLGFTRRDLMLLDAIYFLQEQYPLGVPKPVLIDYFSDAVARFDGPHKIDSNYVNVVLLRLRKKLEATSFEVPKGWARVVRFVRKTKESSHL